MSKIMSTMEQIAHELFAEYGIVCIVEGCSKIPECSHIISQSKANEKIVGVALDLIGVNILPICHEHHMQEHNGVIHKYKPEYDRKLYELARIQLQRYIVRRWKQ